MAACWADDGGVSAILIETRHVKAALTVDVKAPEIADRLAEWVHYYNWDRQHEALNGSTPIDRVCERASKTPLRGEVSDAYEPANEHIQVREHAVETTLRSLKRCP